MFECSHESLEPRDSLDPLNFQTLTLSFQDIDMPVMKYSKILFFPRHDILANLIH